MAGSFGRQRSIVGPASKRPNTKMKFVTKIIFRFLRLRGKTRQSEEPIRFETRNAEKPKLASKGVKSKAILSRIARIGSKPLMIVSSSPIFMKAKNIRFSRMKSFTWISVYSFCSIKVEELRSVGYFVLKRKATRAHTIVTTPMKRKSPT